MAEKIGLEAALDLGAWNSSIDKYIGGVKKMDAETGKTAGSLGKAFDSMGKSVLSVTGMMGKALAGAAAAAGAGIAAFTVNGIKGAAALEAQLSTVAAVLGKTTAEIEPLKAAVYDLALNPNLKVSVDEAAQAFEMLATNGLTMEQIIGGAAEATVLLANATKADFGTAADIATSAMSVFNIEAKDMMGAVNGIVGVTNASKFTINDYALALSQGGGVASAVGVEFRDFNTAIASMAPLFGSGSDAGTSFKTMLQRLVPQSNEASDAMRSLGLFSGLTKDEFADTEQQIAKYKEQLAKLDPESKNFAARSEELNNKITVLEGSLIQGQNAFYNMDGSLKSMNEITSILNGALSGLSDEQRTAALSTIFGSDAMRAAVALGESGAVVYTDLATASQELGISQDELRKYIEGGITAFEVLDATMGQTDALQNAKTNTDNFESAMSILMDTIDAIGRQVGDLFLPYLKQAALALAELAGNAGPTIIAAFQGLIDTFTNLSLYFQLVSEDGDRLNDYLANLPGFIQPIIEIMGGLLVVFQDFQAGALGVDYPWEDVFPPWLANTAYLLSDAVAFVTENLAAFQGAIAGVGAVLAAAGIYQLLLGLAAAIAALNLPMLAIIGTAALVGAAWNANWFGIRDTTLAVVEALTAAFFPLTSAIADFGGIALEEIIAFATGTETQFDALALIWDGLKVSVANVFGGIVATITGLLPVWSTILQGWGTAAVSWITAAIPTATAAISQYAGSMIAALTASDWAGTGTGIMTTLSAGITAAQTTLSTAVLAAANGITTVFNAIDWQALGFAILGFIRAGFELQYGLILAGLAQLMIGIMAVLNSAPWQEIGANMLTLLSAGVEAAKGLLLTAFANIMMTISSVLSTIDWGALGTSMMTMLTAGIDGAKGLLLTTFAGLLVTIRGVWESINWGELGTSLLTRLQAGVESARGALLSLFASMLVTIQGVWNSIDWAGLGNNLLTKIRAGVESARGALVTLFSAILVTIQGIWNSINWTQLGTDLLTKIRAGVEAARGALVTLFSTILVTIQGVWNSIDWTALGNNLLTKIRDGVEAARGALLTLFSTILVSIQAVWNSIDWRALGTSLLTLLQTGVDAAKGALLAAFTAITNSLKDTFNSINWAQVGIDILTKIGQGVGTVAGALMLIIGALVMQVAKLWEIDWNAVGQAIINGIKAGIEFVKELFLASVGRVATSASAKWTDIDWEATGQAILNGIKLGVDAVSAGFLAGFNQIAEDAVGKFEDIEWTVLGANIINWIKSGVTIAAGALLSLVQTTAQDAWDKFTSIDFVSAGKAIIDGIVSGLSNASGALYDKIVQVAEDAWQKFNDTLGISSPSRAFMESGRDIVNGLIAGIKDRAPALNSVIADFGGQIASIWAGGDFSSRMDQLGALVDVFGALNDLGGDPNDPMLATLDWLNKDLDARGRLLKLVASLGIDPSTIGNITSAPYQTLLAGIKEAITPAMGEVRARLLDEQNRLARDFTLRPLLDQLAAQGRDLARVAGTTFTGFMRTAADALQGQLATLDDRIAGARELFLQFGNPQAQADLNRLIEERAALVERMQQLSNAETGSIFRPDASYESALKQQLALIEEARKVGADVSSMRLLGANFGAQDLINLGNIEKMIGLKRIEDLKAQIARALYLDDLNLDFEPQTKAGEAYRKKVLDPILANLNDMVLNDTERNRLIAQYNAEARNLVALDQRQLAFENELTRLRALQSELAGVQSAFGKRYADDVLGPILAKLEDANLLESQRAGLIAQYRAESEKILALKRQEEQLDFLKQQLALIKEVKDNDLNAAQIFNGLTLGINANIGDLLTATQRVVQAMIQKVQGELQIHSPSRVFMNIGKQTIDGLRLGVQKAMQQPIMAQSVPHAAVSSRTLNFAMGGVNIYNGMDEVLFESRVQRIIERSLS